jgi:hypothetical protein
MDQISDNNPVDYLHLLDQLELPEFVKSASADENLNELPDSAFALERTREFPMDSVSSTYQSKVYFELNRSMMKNAYEVLVNSRLNKAAAYFGIAKDFRNIEATAHTAIEKQANADTPEPKYALSFTKDDQLYTAYPITDAEDVRQSAGYLASDKNNMTSDWFKAAAQNIVEAAEGFDIRLSELPKGVVAKGIRREIDTKYAATALGQRERLLREDQERTGKDRAGDIETYQELFKSAKHNTADLQKFANLIEDMDDLCGFDHSDLIDIDQSFWSGPKSSDVEKAASEFIFLGEAMVPAKALVAIPFEKLAQHFSKDTAIKIADIQKKASTLSSIVESVDIDNNIKSLDPEIRAELVSLVVNEA